MDQQSIAVAAMVVILLAICLVVGTLGIVIGKMCAYQDREERPRLYEFQVGSEIRREVYAPPVGEYDPGTLRVYERIE